MMNPLDHSENVGGVFLDHRVMHFMEAERVKCQFLHLGRVDAALYLSDFNLCHQFRLFAVKHFFNSHAAVLGHLGRRTKLAEGGDCGLNKVVGVGRTFRLCKHVGNANTL